jgi:uncharacterized protein with PIN domain
MGSGNGQEGTPGAPPRFFADAMLGRLATWLRILGCDVAYRPAIGDAELVRLAREEGRVVLTRDTRLVRRRWARANSFLVSGDGYREQLRQVVARFGIDPLARPLTRCARCNEPLEAADRAVLEGRVPPYVLSTQDRFSRCPGCGRIYWGATHREAMLREIRAMLP